MLLFPFIFNFVSWRWKYRIQLIVWLLVRPNLCPPVTFVKNYYFPAFCVRNQNLYCIGLSYRYWSCGKQPWRCMHMFGYTIRPPGELWVNSCHGRRSREETCPPRIWSRGYNANCPPQILLWKYKNERSLWPSENVKIRFWPGLRPGPRWGSSWRSPRPPSRLKRGHPSAYPTPLGTNPPSGLAMCPPQNSSQIYAYDSYM